MLYGFPCGLRCMSWALRQLSHLLPDWMRLAHPGVEHTCHGMGITWLSGWTSVMISGVGCALALASAVDAVGVPGFVDCGVAPGHVVCPMGERKGKTIGQE